MGKKKRKKPMMPRLPLEWVLGKGTKFFKDISKYTRKKKHRKDVRDDN